MIVKTAPQYYYLKVHGIETQRHTNKRYAALVLRLIVKRLRGDGRSKDVTGRILSNTRTGPTVYEATASLQKNRVVVKGMWMPTSFPW